MCKQCGCVVYIGQGPEAVLERAVAIIKDLGVTPDNVQRFEDGERVCTLVIASKVDRGEDDELHQIAEWVLSLHQDTYARRSRAYARAAREVFANLPASGSPKEVITTWHELEQLCGHLGDDLISSIGEASVREAMRAVQHVHDNNLQHRDELLRRHHLEGV